MQHIMHFAQGHFCLLSAFTFVYSATSTKLILIKNITCSWNKYELCGQCAP